MIHQGSFPMGWASEVQRLELIKVWLWTWTDRMATLLQIDSNLMCSSWISWGTFLLSLEASQFWFHGGPPAHETARAAWKFVQLCQGPPLPRLSRSGAPSCRGNREESAQMCLDFLGFARSYSWFIPPLIPDHLVPDDLVHSLILSHTLKNLEVVNCNFTSSPKDAPCSWLSFEAAPRSPRRHHSDSSTLLCSSPTSDHT